MRGHLTVLGTTPAEYRAKWGLPADYPMEAPNYTAVRSEMAKNRFGGKPTKVKAKREAQSRS